MVGMNRLLLPVGVLCSVDLGWFSGGSGLGVVPRGRACRHPGGVRTPEIGDLTREPSGSAYAGGITGMPGRTQIGPTAIRRKTKGYPPLRMRVKTGPGARRSVLAGCRNLAVAA